MTHSMTVRLIKLQSNRQQPERKNNFLNKASLTGQFGGFLIDPAVRKDEMPATHWTGKLKVDTNILNGKLSVLCNLRTPPAVRPFNQQWPFFQKE